MTKKKAIVLRGFMWRQFAVAIQTQTLPPEEPVREMRVYSTVHPMVAGASAPTTRTS